EGQDPLFGNNITVEPQKQMGLTDLLADPEMAMLVLQSGKGKELAGLAQIQGQQRTQEFLQGLFSQGGAASPSGTGAIGMPPTEEGLPRASGGLRLTGVKIGPNGQIMPDLSPPKLKMEVPSADGMSMIGVDDFGNEMYRRPMSPGERAKT